MFRRKLGFLLVIIIIGNYLISCTKKNYINKDNYTFKSIDGKPDYSNINYWAAHPWKWDPSDSLPRKFHHLNKDSSVDVFFIHPSTLTDENDERWNATIDDSLLNIKTDYSAILYQASVFNENSRVFAPRYRQAHIKTFFTDKKFQAGIAFEKAYLDVKNAFIYYIKNLHNDRPIIIASHSQGTIHAGRLLKEFFDGKPLQKKLVCAYIIGMPLPEKYLTIIKPCEDSNTTGCFVGWRTYQKGFYDSTYVGKETFRSIVVNPLTWKTDNTYAAANLNTGGVLRDFSKLKKGVVDAQVHQNVLWASKPKFFGSILLTQKNYHIGDINLFYTNIRTNVKTRIESYFKQPI